MILSLGVGWVLGEVVFFVILGKRVLIIVLGESMIEESMWVGVVLGINEVRVFKVYVGSGIIFNFYV